MSERVATEKCPVCGKVPTPITTPNGGVWDAFFKCDCDYIAGYGSTRNESLDDAAEACDADNITNLYPACRACNHYKSTYTVEGFRGIIQRAPTVLMKSSATYRNIARFGLIQHPENPNVRFYFERVSSNE